MEEQATLTDHLLAMLGSCRSKRLYYKILLERVRDRNRGSVYLTLNRLKQKGFIKKYNNTWKLTRKGSLRITHANRFLIASSPFSKNTPKNILLSFDIPETHRRERKWLRDQLTHFDYVMLQKSLWRGPGPLPKTCIIRMKNLGIFEHIKIFLIKKK